MKILHAGIEAEKHCADHIASICESKEECMHEEFGKVHVHFIICITRISYHTLIRMHSVFFDLDELGLPR